MEQTNVVTETQGAEEPMATPNQSAALVLRAVEGHSTVFSATPEPREAPVLNPPFLSDADIQMFQQGTHCRLQDKLGAHPVTVKGMSGVQFAVWAPNAERVSVIGDFNQWDRTEPSAALTRRLRDLGRLRSRSQARVVLQVFHPVALRGLPRGEGRPVCVPRRIAAQKRLHQSGTSTTPGATACG